MPYQLDPALEGTVMPETWQLAVLCQQLEDVREINMPEAHGIVLKLEPAGFHGRIILLLIQVAPELPVVAFDIYPFDFQEFSTEQASFAEVLRRLSEAPFLRLRLDPEWHEEPTGDVLSIGCDMAPAAVNDAKGLERVVNSIVSCVTELYPMLCQALDVLPLGPND